MADQASRNPSTDESEYVGPGLTLILGLTVLSLVILAVIIVTIIICYRLRTSKRSKNHSQRRVNGSTNSIVPESHDASHDESRVSISTVDESVCYNYRYFCRGENVMPTFADNIWEIVTPKKKKPPNYSDYET